MVASFLNCFLKGSIKTQIGQPQIFQNWRRTLALVFVIWGWFSNRGRDYRKILEDPWTPHAFPAEESLPASCSEEGLGGSFWLLLGWSKLFGTCACRSSSAGYHKSLDMDSFLLDFLML